MGRGLRSAFVAAVGLVATACSGDSVPSGEPEPVWGKARGYETKPGIAFGQNNERFWAQAILAEFETTGRDSALPAALTTVAAQRQCAFDRPLAEEHVANVHVGGSPMESPVYSWTDREITERAKRWIGIYQRMKDPPVGYEPTDNYGIVDVAVTETSKPVYLVLQSSDSKLIWNIHKAPGAKISRVAVIGSHPSGVANLDAGVPLSMLAGGELAKCKVVPRRRPADHWMFMEDYKAQKGDRTMEDAMAKFRASANAYSAWLSGQFGIGSETDTVGATAVAQVLVGPLPKTPEQRAVFRPLAGAAIQLSAAPNLGAMPAAAYSEKHSARVRAVATRAAGGKLENLARN